VKESYHSPEFSGIIDQYEKWAVQDHIAPENSTLEQIQNIQCIDIGGFANNPYHIVESSNDLVTLTRVGEARLCEGLITIRITKRIRLEMNVIEVNYLISFSSELNASKLYFIPEINLILKSHPYKTKLIVRNESISIESTTVHQNLNSINFLDMNEQEMVHLTVTFSESCVCSITPIFSLNLTGWSSEKNYQGPLFFPNFL